MAPKSFEDILDAPFTGPAEPPPMVPRGTYLTTVVGPYEEGISKNKGTLFFQFVHRLIEAQDDVDPDELEAYGELDGKTLGNTYYLTPKSLYRLDEFFAHCGINVENPKLRKMSGIDARKSMAADTDNAQVYVTVDHESVGDRTFARIVGTAKA